MTGSISPAIPTIGQPNSTEAADIVSALETLRNGLNDVLTSENKLDTSKLSGTILNSLLEVPNKYKVYTPVIIPGEGSIVGTSYGTIETESKKEEIKNIVVPENGLVRVKYKALMRNTESQAIANIFIDNNALKMMRGTGYEEAIAIINPGLWYYIVTTASGLYTDTDFDGAGEIAEPTTGVVLGARGESESSKTIGSETIIYGLPAGTYTLSVKFKSTVAGKTTKVKQRKLWVAVEG